MKKIQKGLLALALLSATLAAHADTLAYAAIDGGDFGTLDLDTGVYTQLSETSVFPTTLAGLADLDGTLYGTPLFGSALYLINPATGSYTTVGTNSVSYYDFGSTLTGLYALDRAGNLYSIDPTTGAVIKDIGNVGLGQLGYSSLSDNSGTLYFINAPSQSVNTSSLYSLNTATAQLTLISSSVTGNQFTAMLTTNGKLYGVSNTIYTFNPSTGSQSSGLAVSGESGAGVYGLAPDPVPLPGSALLLLSGVGFFLLAVGRRRQPRGDLRSLAA